MFNLEQAISNWKRHLRRNPAFEDGDIAELESHIREEVARLQGEGLSEEEAFGRAAAEIGEPERLGDELYRSRASRSAGPRPPWKNKSLLSTLLPNYVRITIRNIRKSPVYSAVNIAGLALGIACCVLIVIYLQYQFSFDGFHSSDDRIYRLNKVVSPTTGGTEYHAITSGPMGPQMKRDYPEVEEVVRLLPWFDSVLMSREQQSLKVDQFVLADSTFFDLFDFKLLRGDPQSALDDPLSVVLSERVARHFFGEEDPLGESIEGLNGFDYTVSGVIENTPEESHFRYDVLVSWSSTAPSALDMGWLDGWFPQAIYTYLLLKESDDKEALEDKLGAFMQQHFPQRAEQYEPYLQPLDEIYLHSSHIRHDENVRTGSITNVYIFSAVAVLVLLIACINFMNLSTARSMDRAREVGVRKVLGASRGQLGWQFLAESVALSLLAMLFSLGLVRAGLPVLEYLGMPAGELSIAAHPIILLVLLGVALFTGLVSGSYPALVLSGFKPARVLSGRIQNKGEGGALLRKALVTFQFALSIALIIGTLVINRQMEYISQKNMGFRGEQVVVLQLGGTDINNQKEAFRDELGRHSNIIGTTVSNSVPGSSFMSFGIEPEGKDPDQEWVTNVMRLGDDKLLEIYGMGMAAGRFFNEDRASDTSAVVINQALARSLGWEEPVGRQIAVPGELGGGRVIGVVRDFHTSSLHNSVEPLLMMLDSRGSFLSLRINPSGMEQTLSYIESTWNNFDPNYPMEYHFLNDRFEAFYTAEQRTFRVVFLFTGLAIFVACLGLFGLSTFLVNQRTKEIGIRKILGSSIAGIVRLVSRDFLVLVGTGFLVAAPAAWWLSSQWLQDFAYRVDIGVWIFLAGGLIAFVLAMVAVLWQSLRAAYMNPVICLKNE